MKRPVIGGIGELLWDVLPDGEVLGGAPVNFCYHINALGGIGIPISTIGKDSRGTRALEILEKKNIEVSAISVLDHYPTGYVIAELDTRGSATYTFPDDTAWDHLTLNTTALELQQQLSAICFGTLAQRTIFSRKAILNFLDTLPEETIRVFDINLRGRFYSADIITDSLLRTDILKLSIEELEVLRKLYDGSEEVAVFLRSLLQEYELTMVILTRGSGGSLLITGNSISDHPGLKTSVVDTIGAGDSFTAFVVMGYIAGLELDVINRKASEIASYVCSQRGAMPAIPEQLALTA